MPIAPSDYVAIIGAISLAITTIITAWRKTPAPLPARPPEGPPAP